MTDDYDAAVALARNLQARDNASMLLIVMASAPAPHPTEFCQEKITKLASTYFTAQHAIDSAIAAATR
jgi:hypothetical protein